MNYLDYFAVYPTYPYYYTSYIPQNIPRTEAFSTQKLASTVFCYIKGGPLAPDLTGFVRFSDAPGGTYVSVEVTGLPPFQPAQKDGRPIGPHGFHIHQFSSCEIGDPKDPFKSAGEHWNPTNQPHGNHAGDFPVLFSNNGYARMEFFTNKFKPQDVIGKSIIIHQSPDDYRSQPAGDAGKRLGCGVIVFQ